MKALSFAAVLGGIFANFLAVPVDAALHVAHVFPAPGLEMSDPQLALAFGYRAILAVLGGGVVARLAPSSPMTHAWVLAGVGVVLSTTGAVTQWRLGHHWYPISLIALCIPATWLGARLALGAQK